MRQKKSPCSWRQFSTVSFIVSFPWREWGPHLHWGAMPHSLCHIGKGSEQTGNTVTSVFPAYVSRRDRDIKREVCQAGSKVKCVKKEVISEKAQFGRGRHSTNTQVHTQGGVIPSCSVFVISSSFFCFSVSTTSARLPLRRSGVPKADPLSKSLRSRAPSSGLCGEVELFRKEYKEHTLLLSDSCRDRKKKLRGFRWKAWCILNDDVLCWSSLSFLTFLHSNAMIAGF